jgi:hypothetical protein
MYVGSSIFGGPVDPMHGDVRARSIMPRYVTPDRPRAIGGLGAHPGAHPYSPGATVAIGAFGQVMVPHPIHHGATVYEPGAQLAVSRHAAGLTLPIVHGQLPVMAGGDIFGAPVTPMDPARSRPVLRQPPVYHPQAPETVYDYGGGMFPIQRRAGVFGQR